MKLKQFFSKTVNVQRISSVVLLLLFITTVAVSSDRTKSTEEETITPAASVANSSISGTAEIRKSESIIHALQDVNRFVAQKCLPEVVEIDVVETISTADNGMSNGQWGYLFNNLPFSFPGLNQQREYQQQGLGSGVLIKQEGNKHYIITNNHVVGNADEIKITLYDGREYEGQITGTDPRTDLALVYFESDEEIPVLKLGNAADLKVGDFTYAIGNPLGYESTITSGIISALGRKSESNSIADFTDYIQTDAAINPGNSGGALVDIDGNLIGLNTWIASSTGGSDGIGFAIPVNTIERAINDFIVKGKIEYGWLGVSISDINDTIAAEESDLYHARLNAGAFVGNLFLDSPAADSKIKAGDIITEVNGVAISNADELSKAIGTAIPGQNVRLTIVREGKQKELTVTLKTRDEQAIENGSLTVWPGLYVGEMNENVARQLNVQPSTEGLFIAGIIEGSEAEDIGLQQGDVITEISGKKITTLLEFYKQLNADNTPSITILRNGRTNSYSLHS